MRVTALIREPLAPRAALGAACGLAAAVAGYCLAYTGLAGRSEGLSEALAWAVVNVLPWFAAFEAAKRGQPSALVLAAALAGSMLLHLAVYGLPGQPLFELVRRLPGALLVLALLGLGRVAEARAARPPAALPLLPRQIDWIGAAGNYVELHSGGRTIVHRAPLAAVEAELAEHGFVRIHRSTLVRRSAIARVRSVDILLADGTSLKLGKRYRSALTAPETRPFVPAE